MQTQLFLASESPRRHELLKQIGVPHEILHVPSPPGEDEPRLSNESPRDYVRRTALDKAIRAQYWIVNHRQLKQFSKNQIAILTADTTVAIDNLVLGKPKDANEASQILRLLSGKTHTVLTALVLSQLSHPKDANNQKAEWHQWQALSITQVSFCELSERGIQDYISTGEPFGKAGAYGIQGHAAKFIQRIEGSYSGVMGLPLFETNELLKQLS